MGPHPSVEDTASRLVISRTTRPIARAPPAIWEILVCMQGRGASGRASVAYIEVSTLGRVGWAVSLPFYVDYSMHISFGTDIVPSRHVREARGVLSPCLGYPIVCRSIGETEGC